MRSNSKSTGRIWIGIVAALVLVLGVVLVAVGLFVRTGEAGRDRHSEAAAASEPRGDRNAAPDPSARPEFETAAKATITGTVRDLDGQPIADAQVCAWPNPADLDGVPAGMPRCVRSEDDGHYRLDSLLPIRAQLSAEARGYLPQRWRERHDTYELEDLELRPGQTREGVDFRLPAGGVAIAGVVRDISGGVIEGAWVTAHGRSVGVGPSVTWTDAEGRFETWVAPPNARIVAEADGYARERSWGRYVAAPSREVELILTPESIIVGRVVLAGTDEPVAGVVVSAKGDGFFSANDTARSDDGGRFEITKLQPGIYDLSARSDELYGEAGRQVHVALAETSGEVLITLHPARLVSGLVRYAGVDGQPCPSGSVRLRGRDDASRSHWAELRAGGEVEIPGVLAGAYSVTVACAGAVSEAEYPDLEVADASVTGQVWEVREGQAIAGEVVDADGQGVAGATVYATKETDADDPRAQQSEQGSLSTGEDGQFRVAGLLPGRYRIRVWGENIGTGPEPITVELEPGADRNDVRIELPATGTVRGLVRDAQGTPQVGVQVRGSGLARQSYAGGVTGDDGRFVLERVGAGELRITANQGMTTLRSPGTTDDDEQGVVVEVLAGETHEVELIVEAQTARITGRVLDETGAPVADAFVSHRRVSDSAAASAGSSKRSLRWDFYDRPVLTDIDGKFVVDGLSDSATYALGAFRKGGGEALLDGVAPGEDVELTIVATGALAGKLVVDGGPLPDRAMVSLLEPKEGLRRSDALFRTDGAFAFEELPPGIYTLTVDSSAGSAELPGIELEAGERIDDLVVTLTPRVTVRGRLVDIDTRAPVPGMTARIGARKGGRGVGSNEPGDKHISDSDGRFEIADARTGNIRLTVFPRVWGGDSEYDWTGVALQLSADQDVVELGDIELIRRRLSNEDKPGDLGFTLAGRDPEAEEEDFVATVAVVRPGGPADAAGLVVGDVIESIDGHDIRGVNGSRFYTLSAVAEGTAVKLGLAGKEAVTITAGKPIG